MEKVKFLREFVDRQDVQAITEEIDDMANVGKTIKKLYVQGPFLQGDITNKNGRVYPVPMLENAVGVFMKTKKRGIGIPGELNHPQSSIQVDLDRVSHYVTELRMDGKNGMGKALIASTPKGEVARCMLNDGLVLGVSTRGVGRLSEDQDNKKIVSEFELITVDLVSDPSAPDAFVEAVMEGLEYYVDKNSGTIALATTVEQMLESIKKQLTTLPKKTEQKNSKLFDIINGILDKV